MGKFKLINPVLAGDGSVKTVFDEKTPKKAADKFWNSLAEKNLLVNEVHRFMFTLKEDNDKLHHFEVKEQRDGDEVKYELDEVKISVTPEEEKKLIKEAEKVEQKLLNGEKPASGGKRKRYHKDSSDSSDSDSDSDEEFDFDRLRKRMYKSPISYWWYSPLIYRVRRLYTPVFAKPIAPYVQLWLPMR